MSPSNSPLGKNLRSLAGKLTLWMKPKQKAVPQKKELIEVPQEVPEKAIRSPKAASVPVAKIKPQKPVRAHPLPKVIISEPEPQPEPEPAPAPVIEKIKAEPVGDLLSAFPDTKNLVGQPPLDFTLDGKNHSLMIRTDSMFLDAQKYLILAGGGALGSDVELDILELKRDGDAVTLRAGAFGKEATVSWNETEWSAVLDTLLRGKTCKATTDKGQTLEIARNNY